MRSIAATIAIAAALAACQGKPQAGPGEDRPVPSPAVATQQASAAEAVPAAAPAPAAQEVAVYKLAGLDDGTVKKLVATLADHGGVVSAQGDVQAGLFRVTFEPGKTTPADITPKLAAVSPGISLDKVEAPAGGPALPQHDCGGCPMHNVCGGEH